MIDLLLIQPAVTSLKCFKNAGIAQSSCCALLPQFSHSSVKQCYKIEENGKNLGHCQGPDVFRVRTQTECLLHAGRMAFSIIPSSFFVLENSLSVFLPWESKALTD